MSYNFKIIVTKYKPLTRGICMIFSFLLWIPGLPAIAAMVDLSGDIGIVLFMLIPLGLIFNWYISPLLFESYNTIGSITLDEVNLLIQTKEIEKEINIKDISVINFKGGLGSMQAFGTCDTYIASILLKDGGVFTIHVTREFYKNNIKQSATWGKNESIFRVLKKFKIKYEMNNFWIRKVKEIDCISK